MGFMQAPTGGGDFNTFLKYDARSGRWHTKPDGGGDLYEVDNMTAVMDIANIRTGWFQFFEGSAPVKVFDPSLTEMSPRPDPEAKRGFEVLVFSDKNIGGLREFTSTAGTVIEAMNTLYDKWMEEKNDHRGQLPVVKCIGVSPVKTAKSTNYSPAMEIVAWTDRPSELPDAAEPGATGTTKAKATPAAPPKAPEPAAAAAGNDAPEF